MREIVLAGGCFWGVEEYLSRIKGVIDTEVKPLITYYKAEEYHQKYLQKNPGGYCHIDLNL